VSTPSEVEQIAFALCHEVGNWLAAIRLQAHLLDESLGARELAEASLEIDELCARSGALLAQLRPLLSPPPAAARAVAMAPLLHDVARSLDEQGLRGVALALEAPEDLPEVRAASEVLHPLLFTLAFGALEASRPAGRVRLSAVASEREVSILVEDAVGLDEPLSGWRDQPRRGRVLGCALAGALARKLGGRLDVVDLDPGTRIEVAVPRAPAA
jgi:C4-dicarboxylate-specific signal transduction histidine kinase